MPLATAVTLHTIMETFLIATDFLLLLFWVRLWSQPERELYFNPFLSAPTRLTDKVLDFLRPALPLPERLVVLLLMLFLLVFRAVALARFLPLERWEITIGAVMRYTSQGQELQQILAFSALHFFFFIARFWGVYVLMQLLTPVFRRDRASEAFHFAALPLSALHRRWTQILLLVAVHGMLVFELGLLGTPSLPQPIDAQMTAPALCHETNPWLALGCLTLFSVADLLMMAWQMMFALLVGSFAASMLQNSTLNAVCTESVAAMLGTRRRFIIGFIDLTPLLYMLSVYLLYTAVLLPLLLELLTKCQ